MRIIVGGFQHETNTFAPSKADWDAFKLGGGWPGMARGEAVFPAIQGANIPAAVSYTHLTLPTILLV